MSCGLNLTRPLESREQREREGRSSLQGHWNVFNVESMFNYAIVEGSIIPLQWNGGWVSLKVDSAVVAESEAKF